LRKECSKDFESTYLTTKSNQETRSFTPLSDIVLCKSPAIPQSDSRGLFNRLHELSTSSPDYYINPLDGIDTFKGRPNSPCSSIDVISDSEVDAFEDNASSAIASSLPRYEFRKYEENDGIFSNEEQSRISFLGKDEKHETESLKYEENICTITWPKKTTSFGTVGALALATTDRASVNNSNTFLPELRLKEAKAQMQSILSNSNNTSGTRVRTYSKKRKGSFREMPIGPPQITVDFAMGIFDPKKRQLHKKISYAAID
jgi:hypothetical protein